MNDKPKKRKGRCVFVKKIERLRWIQSIFGQEFVLKYFFCGNWKEISQAIDYFENRGQTWGMRTDTNYGSNQGYLCPFLFKGLRQEAAKIREAKPRKIILFSIRKSTASFLPRRCGIS